MDNHHEADTNGLARSREGLASLIDELAGASRVSGENLDRVVKEVTAGVEELLVADEELRTQTEELIASRDAIDSERERYGELFEFAPDAYLVTDEQGKILEANSAASRLLGVPARWLEGKLLVSFVDEAERRDFRMLLRELSLSPRQIDEHYLRVLPREGEPFVAAARAASHPTPGGSSLVVRWMMRDITQRLEMEEEIRFLHAEVDLLASLARVARLTTEPVPLSTMLEPIVELAGRSLPNCEVSLVLSGDRHPPDLVAASGERARQLHAIERKHGDGPCRAASLAGEPAEHTVEELSAEWAAFGDEAGQLGLRVVIAHPLSTPSGKRGSLNVYAFATVGREARELVPLLVDQVVTALANADLYESANGLATHLQQALESRGVIERAKGVLMGRQGCTDEEAFDILRRASQRTNRKLRDVAADLMAHVQSAERPPPAPGD